MYIVDLFLNTAWLLDKGAVGWKGSPLAMLLGVLIHLETKD